MACQRLCTLLQHEAFCGNESKEIKAKCEVAELPCWVALTSRWGTHAEMGK